MLSKDPEPRKTEDEERFKQYPPFIIFSLWLAIIGLDALAIFSGITFNMLLETVAFAGLVNLLVYLFVRKILE
jgi:membrane protein YqaA with SNARE-associated domain